MNLQNVMIYLHHKGFGAWKQVLSHLSQNDLPSSHKSRDNVKFTTWWAQPVEIIIIFFDQISSLQSKSCQFPTILKKNTFDFAILNSWKSSLEQMDTIEIKSIHYVTRNYFFAFAKDFQHVLSLWNAFQNRCKWFLKNLKYIHIRYEHFITHSQ